MKSKRIISPEKAGYVANLKISDNQILTGDVQDIISNLEKDSEDEKLEDEEIISSLTEKINKKRLLKLKEKFNQADTDQGGALELEEFVAAFGSVLGKNLTKRELVQLFMRIDTNSDGSIDWDEFMNFIILENENLAHMRAEHCEYYNPKIPDPTASQKTNLHNDMISKLLIINSGEGADTCRYVTGSYDGTVKIWNPSTLTPSTNIQVSENWVTSLAYLKNYERLAAGSTDRSISFYDLNKSNESISNPLSRINDLRGIPLCMEYIEDESMFIAGDDQGYIYLYKLYDGWHICNTRMPCHKTELISTQNNQLSNHEKNISKQKQEAPIKGVKFKTHFMENIEIIEKSIHSSWITKVEYIPDLDSLMTCSLDKTITQFDLERHQVKSTYNYHKKGVLSFVWCPDFKFVASCGEERVITLWNPYNKKGAKTLLQGHNSAIVDIALNQDKFQLVSLGTDKVVKVWDIRTYKCVQTIVDKTIYRPENRLTGVYFNPLINSLLLTSKKINVWPFKAQEELPTSHESIVTCAIFNRNFNCIISGDEESNIHIWNLKDGKLLFKFSEAHGRNRITAMSLDSSHRRLITGGHDGSIKMWNFNNGHCLREFNYDQEPKEVSKIMFIGNENSSKLQHIVSVGWDKHVYVWPDENDQVVSWIKCLPKSGQLGHTDDILSLAYSPKDRFVITGGQSGQIIAWHFETGFPRAYLHEIDSTLLPSPERPSKAVEELIYATNKEKLLSISADCLLRFWDLREMRPLKTVEIIHCENDLITCAYLSSNEITLVTGDESGNVKIWNVLDNLEVESLLYFNAHQGAISSLQLFSVEDCTSNLLLTTGLDRNVKLFTEEGYYLGYFGQAKTWNLEYPSTDSPPKSPKQNRQVFVNSGSPRSPQFHFEEEGKEVPKIKPIKYINIDRPKTNKIDTTSSDVFRRINIEKFKIEQIPGSWEESYRSKTGKNLNLSVTMEKKR